MFKRLSSSNYYVPYWIQLIFFSEIRQSPDVAQAGFQLRFKKYFLLQFRRYLQLVVHTIYFRHMLSVCIMSFLFISRYLFIKCFCYYQVSTLILSIPTHTIQVLAKIQDMINIPESKGQSLGAEDVEELKPMEG